MLHKKAENPPLMNSVSVVGWLLAALGAAASIVLPAIILSSAGGTPLWPMPGLLLLTIAVLGLAAFAGVAGFAPQALRGPAAAWFACGALATLGVFGWIGVSVIFFALAPAALFGLAAGLVVSQQGKGWRAGLNALILGAGISAVVLFVLVSLS